jgi:hypothetical protein
LVGSSTYSGDQGKWAWTFNQRSPHCLGRQLQNRRKKINSGIADLKLGRMDSDGETARTSIQIIAGQRPLSPFIQAPARIKGQRMRWDDLAMKKMPAKIDHEWTGKPGLENSE